jgi:hypothetical protein
MSDLFTGSYAVPDYVGSFLLVVTIAAVILLVVIDWDPNSGD